MSKRLGVIFCMLFMICVQVRAQDPHFSQFSANHVHVNPAMAGMAVCPRVYLTYRDQWPGIQGAFKTFMFSYDQYFDGIRGGIGLWVMNDRQSNAFSTNYAALIYSHRIQVSDNFFINAALQATIINQSLNWEHLKFGDMIDPRYGFIHHTQAQKPDNLSKTVPDFSAGFVAYSDIWYAGVGLDHLTQPANGLYSKDGYLPFKATVHGGAKLDFARERRRTSFLFSQPIFYPGVMYMHQQNFNTLVYGLNVDCEPFLVGAWFRNNISFSHADALIFLIGIKQAYYRISYSYDMTLSSLSTLSGGSHEVSIGWQFDCPEKRKKIKKISCPSF